MTKLLEQALEVARNLPSDVQDDIARRPKIRLFAV